MIRELEPLEGTLHLISSGNHKKIYAELHDCELSFYSSEEKEKLEGSFNFDLYMANLSTKTIDGQKGFEIALKGLDKK